jgi:hypothetical protein
MRQIMAAMDQEVGDMVQEVARTVKLVDMVRPRDTALRAEMPHHNHSRDMVLEVTAD